MNKLGNNKIIVIGYGNPLRGDDGIGEIVLEKLKTFFADRDSKHDSMADNIYKNIEFINRQQLDVVDTEAVSESRAVIFIDAHVDDKLDDISIQKIVPLSNITPNVSHISSPEEFISITEQVFGSHPPAYLCAVRGYEFAFGTTISDQTLELASKATKEIERLLETLQN